MILYFPGHIAKQASSGSQVRLLSVKDFFETSGFRVIEGSFCYRQVTLLGLIFIRRKQEIYVETASIPFFMSSKRLFLFTMLFEIILFCLLALRHEVSVYYRDAHWMFPQFDASVKNKCVRYVYKLSFNIEKHIIQLFASKIYVPTKSFGEYVFPKITCIPLPPGVNASIFEKIQKKRLLSSRPIINSVVYVGGLSNELYNLGDYLKRLKRFDVSIISRPQEIETFITEAPEWIKFYSFSDDQLENFCIDKTFFLLAFNDSLYMRMAIPVKLFRCLELGMVPLYACKGEVESLLSKYEIGLSLDSPEFDKFCYMSNSERLDFLQDQHRQIKHFISDNSWDQRFRQR